MIRFAFFLFGLLVLGGCASEPYVLVSYKPEVKKCGGQPQCVGYTETNGVLDSVKMSDGRVLTGSGLTCSFSMTGYVLGKGDSLSDCVDGKMTLSIHPRSMSATEFRFRYDHDKAFRDSIASYSFQ